MLILSSSYIARLPLQQLLFTPSEIDNSIVLDVAALSMSLESLVAGEHTDLTCGPEASLPLLSLQ